MVEQHFLQQMLRVADVSFLLWDWVRLLLVNSASNDATVQMIGE